MVHGVTIRPVATGSALIAAGALMLWSARAYTDARADVHAAQARALDERGAPVWFRRIVAPTGSGVRRTERYVASTLGLGVVLAGCLRLLGVWS